jgi:hypothetical protein
LTADQSVAEESFVGDREPEPPYGARPHLWNPNAAANWSLLLSPAFGAYLHAANWRALGKPDRAAANMVWVWATVAFLLVSIVTLFVPESKTLEGVMRFAGLGLLLSWYFSQGRPQAKYVKETLGDDYIKKGWGLPLLVGWVVVGAYVAIVFVIAIATYKPDPKELATAIKPLIQEEWQKKPELRDATIQDVTLAHQDGNRYAGFVDATFGGKSERLTLEVTLDGENIQWQLKAPGK